MRYTALSTVQDLIVVGAPLPFNILNNDHTLLLAKGQTVDDKDQLQALLQREKLVDQAELHRSFAAVIHAPEALLPALWLDNRSRIAQTLRHIQRAGFGEALEDLAYPMMALIERDPDLAIAQVVVQEEGVSRHYAARRSMQAAITCHLVARRLGWDAEDCARAFKAALTMNVAMQELQLQLAQQTSGPTDEQRRLIHAHPVRGREMLIEAGISDLDWLRAVEQHHEQGDSSGYPYSIKDPSLLAVMLQRCDIYTAKLSARLTRPPMTPDIAARDAFMNQGDNPIAVAMAQEFGAYPPGTRVVLASGEQGVVLRRSDNAATPVVAVDTTPGTPQHQNALGHASEQGLVNHALLASLSQATRRDTAQAAYAITQTLPCMPSPRAATASPPSAGAATTPLASAVNQRARSAAVA